MRSLIAAILVAALLAAGAVGYTKYVNKTADELNAYANSIERAIEERNFDKAKNTALELMELVDRKKEVLGAIADHGDIYEIQRSLAELVCLAEEGEVAESRARCAAVVVQIERLSGNSSPAIFNIL